MVVEVAVEAAAGEVDRGRGRAEAAGDREECRRSDDDAGSSAEEEEVEEEGMDERQVSVVGSRGR